ncbi:Pimeloyl-ACP methyl ester carboxylesterase [Amphritea atlantica]|uniref:Pimeloyl-ACP methyl ester carboxylesterase n=1 Tax=Amphritea atlantica TaxID=355243 RepID=A0A1H9G064_9GAMM|nr:alpha/beta hydrolase [Amphritea atlantica]SEQ43530.1 Pimeloyl-ACP methyl ester carboxylesterase [Amphritea atlantica]
MKIINIFNVGVFSIALVVLAACVSVPSVSQRTDISDQLAVNQGWQSEVIETPLFDLMSYQSKQKQAAPLLTVYIEGDGFAWRTASIPSTDPTPINPIGLKLALIHPDGNAIYLARPCQYVGGSTARNCDNAYWTGKRFSEEVIAATNQVITELKAQFSAEQLQLVGYSGGGAVAALIAARRDDVIRLITIAGNLDHQAWTDAKQLSPLRGSLNPADAWLALTNIEQIHLIGGKDLIVSPSIVQSYKQHFKDDSQIKIITFPDYDHHCCWTERWNTLSANYLSR